MGPGTAAAALDQPSQRYQHCRQSQNYHCDKYHRVGWHVCQKIDHLALPPAVPNAKRRTPQLRARSNESAKTAMLRSARFRFVIFIKKKPKLLGLPPDRGAHGFHFLSFRRTQNNRCCLSFPPYNPLVFSAMYSSSVVRTDGGSFGADNMRSMIDTESPEAL